MKIPMKRVENQTEAFQSRSAQERLIAIFSKYDWRGAAVTAKFKIGVAHFSSHG